MRKIIYGGDWRPIPPEGWISIPQSEQDLTTPLKQDAASVDAIFTEHQFEHLTLIENINCLREYRRVLRSGGILRLVMPMIDQLVKFRDGSALSESFTKFQLSHYYPEEFAALERLGINPNSHGQPFLFDSLLKKH